MNLVSSSKMARAKTKYNRGKPFFDQMRRVIGNVISGGGEVDHEYFADRPINRTLIVVIANDRGLCGGYNTNICKLAFNLVSSIRRDADDVSVFTIGNKARDFFRNINRVRRKTDADRTRWPIPVIGHISGISENPFYENAKEIADEIMAKYAEGEFDQVYVCYTEFVSAITYEPKKEKILPLEKEDFEGSDVRLMKFEPSASYVLDYVIPKYLTARILEVLSTSAAAGQAATMTAMDSATENADSLIGNLTLMYNRARQAAITQEISEIVGGANALT
jgi:F-type H+-transporting ATPase subunit gamma